MIIDYIKNIKKTVNYRSNSLDVDKADIDEHISIEIHESDNVELSVSQSEEQDIPRKSPSEPISTLCSSMRRQIISRAFYGWLAHCRYKNLTIICYLKVSNFKCRSSRPKFL